MTQLRRITALMLVLITLTSSLFLSTATAAQVKPSTPQATIKFVNATYPVPSTDPYTGKTSTVLAGNYSVIITIKNQAVNDPNSQIYYNVRIKPHYDPSKPWAEIFGVWYYISKVNGDTLEYAYFISPYAPIQSAGSYTTITLTLKTDDVYGKPGIYYRIPSYYNATDVVPDGGEVDFQVQTLTGHATQRWVSRSPFTTTVGGQEENAVALDAASDWSETQTVRMGDGATAQETQATPEPQTSSGTAGLASDNNWQVNDLVVLVVAVSAVIIVTIVAVAAVLIKRAKTQTAASTPN
jgi:hypothetical protein